MSTIGIIGRVTNKTIVLYTTKISVLMKKYVSCVNYQMRKIVHSYIKSNATEIGAQSTTKHS